MDGSILELDARSRHQISNRARGQYLVRARHRCYPGTGVHGDPSQFPVYQLTFPGMQARADLQPEFGDRGEDAAGAADCPPGPVEARQEPVAGDIDLVAAKTIELLANRFVMPLAEIPPASIAQLRGARSRTDDIGE